MWQDYFVCHACTCHPLYKIVFLLKCTAHCCLVISLRSVDFQWCIHFFYNRAAIHWGWFGRTVNSQLVISLNVTELPVGCSVWRSRMEYPITWIHRQNCTTFWIYPDVLRLTFKQQSKRFSPNPNNNKNLLGIKIRQDISNITEIETTIWSFKWCFKYYWAS